MTEPVPEPQTTDADDVTDAASTTAHTLLVGKAVRGQLVCTEDVQFRCGQCLLPALEDIIKSLLAKAVERARRNGRRTVRGYDL